MISALTGQLRRVDDGRVHVQCGPMLYELLVPAADVEQLRGMTGDELTFHTVFYLAGDPTRGGLEPTLIGFLRPEDRKFFGLFTTVKGIGAKTALRALTVSVAEIVEAIEAKDTRALQKLDGIGKRTAELIVAELGGKLKEFASAGVNGTSGALGKKNHLEEEAIAVLVALGERRADAERLLERARQSNGTFKTVDALSREMLRLRTTRS
ncbi:MAG: Holliday junction branch migration protein RuvA [Tepidisphaeraceae bacterium]